MTDDASATLPATPTGIREIELNQRPALVSASRCATYSGPLDIRLRFLHATLMPPTALHPDECVVEITNVADVSLPPAVAKRLLVDLAAAVNSYEERMGQIVPLEELEQLWSRGVGTIS